jgi:hypothetical protein
VTVGDDLRTAGAVHAHHARQPAPVLRGHLICHRHRPIAAAAPVREEARRFALEQAGAERLIPDAALEREVQSVANVDAIGTSEHAPVTKGSRTIFHRALEPHHDLSVLE